jgi:transposase-like protein
VDWKKLRAEYIAGGTSYRKLAEKHNVSFHTLRKQAAKENWKALKDETTSKTVTKIIEIESDKQAERMKRLLSVSDELLLVVEDAVKKFKAEELMLDRTALKSLSGTIKDIKDIQSLKTSLDIEEQKARIAILKKQAEADTNGSTEVSITFGIDEEQNKWAE